VCYVLEGEQCLAINMHVRKIATPKSLLGCEDECTDEDDRYVGWATGGECDRNLVFMISSPNYYGTCRKSCHVC
jgi:prolyl 4-hydroxylase